MQLFLDGNAAAHAEGDYMKLDEVIQDLPPGASQDQNVDEIDALGQPATPNRFANSQRANSQRDAGADGDADGDDRTPAAKKQKL